MRILAVSAMSAIFGAALVLACSDDSPQAVDAAEAECNCPAAEPPLADRIFVVQGSPLDITVNNSSNANAVCPEGSIILGGDCIVEDPELGEDLGKVHQIDAQRIGKASNIWSCRFQNNASVTVNVRASVTCFTPAPN